MELSQSWFTYTMRPGIPQQMSAKNFLRRWRKHIKIPTPTCGDGEEEEKAVGREPWIGKQPHPFLSYGRAYRNHDVGVERIESIFRRRTRDAAERGSQR